MELWPWMCTAATEHFQKLTGRRIKVFNYIKDELDYECFLPGALKQLRSDLEKKSPSQQMRYVQRIARDYYIQARPFERYIKKYESARFRSYSDNELIAVVREWMKYYPRLSMQAWYAVLIDIWYPSPSEHVQIKRVIGKARDHLGHIHARANKVDCRLYGEIGRRIHTSVHSMSYLFPDEVITALEKKECMEPLVQQRKKLCIASDYSGELKLYHGQAARRLAAKYDIPQAGKKKQRILRGTPAHPGKVLGRVRKILLDTDFPKFKKGEILVALQTMVHYVPLMKKSKAILTEFGGLTSHAAIVSRELKKPCIVSVPNLITSLKDGDRVEVDAEKGVIKKL